LAKDESVFTVVKAIKTPKEKFKDVSCKPLANRKNRNVSSPDASQGI